MGLDKTTEDFQIVEVNVAVTLLEALGLYTSSLKKRDHNTHNQQQLLKFIHWCGSDRSLSDLSPSEIDDYGGHSTGDRGPRAAEGLQEVRKFLAFTKKKGLIDQNLAQHLRVRRGQGRSRRNTSGDEPETIELTPAGYNQMINEVESLKAERIPIAAEIGRAAADKDFRENAPLEAAREQLGLIESRIREIEHTMKVATVIDLSKRKKGWKTVGLGSKVLIKDLGTGRQTRYTIVSATEARPLEGKISNVSPVGKALVKRTTGQEIEVETPRGTQRYRIVRVSS